MIIHTFHPRSLHHFTSLQRLSKALLFADINGTEGTRNKQVLGEKITDVEQKIEHSHINQGQRPKKGAYNLESVTFSDALQHRSAYTSSE